jgi:hypothetical protein
LFGFDNFGLAFFADRGGWLFARRTGPAAVTPGAPSKRGRVVNEDNQRDRRQNGQGKPFHKSSFQEKAPYRNPDSGQTLFLLPLNSGREGGNDGVIEAENNSPQNIPKTVAIASAVPRIVGVGIVAQTVVAVGTQTAGARRRFGTAGALGRRPGVGDSGR